MPSFDTGTRASMKTTKRYSRIRALAGFLAVLATGCPTLDLGEAPIEAPQCRPDPGYFEDIIYPMYIEAGGSDSCIGAGGCHDVTDTPSSAKALTAATPPWPGHIAVSSTLA